MDHSVGGQDLTSFVVIGICLLCSAFFSASETAITSLGTLKARFILEKRGKSVSQLNLWLSHPERVLTTILIFNNVVNILASALATQIASHYFKSNVVGIATGSITLLVLVFGEIVPKSIAKAHAETFGPLALKVINLIYRVTYPAVYLFSEFANGLMKVLGAEKKEGPDITEEELEHIVKVGQSSGALLDFKKDMIDGIFDFDDTKVREIMTPRTDIYGVEVDESVEKALALIIETGYSRFPIYDKGKDNVIGILLAKDLLRFAAGGVEKDATVKSFLREPFFVPESKMIVEVFRDLKRSKNHLAIIIDEYGGTAGLVTMEDIIEQIVGDIQDEYDVEEAKILEIEANVYDVSGSVNIDEFLEFFGLEGIDLNVEREQDVDTIGGWLTQLLGKLPKVGLTTQIGPLKAEISEVERHRIQRIRVTKQDEAQKDTDEVPALEGG